MLLLDDTGRVLQMLGNMHESCVDNDNHGSIFGCFSDVILDRAPTRAAGDYEFIIFRRRFFSVIFDGLLILSLSVRPHVQRREGSHHIQR